MKRSIPLSLTAAAMMIGTCHAAVLVNGDFEISGAGNPTFTGWNEVSNDTAVDSKGSSAIIGGAHLSGTTSVEMVALAANGGAIRQTVPTALSQFTVSLDFAALSPDAAADVSTRYFSMQLKHGAVTSVTQINLRVAKSGQLQAYDGASWQAVGSLVAAFSVDTGTAGAWGGETVVTNSLTITGDYTGAPTYSVNLNGTTVSGLNYFQGGAPATGTNTLNSVSFYGGAAAKNFLVDNVAVVPEPATGCLVSAAGLGLFIRRRSGATECMTNPLKTPINRGI
ncbi:PEP-CTERM sorting domain-containing protein [Luteolibacter sp. SL250]|uniref:PEP-CTERM sorting domain-containing protein n=1 Tax=Luteolibacter sp. SL250 TaxID=2995170 RepID=UPI00226FB294|nr:PEP-CTERM sorting domain-containing protein [Luteolibacter sp. SL250]WAC18050.1 PEP-CTERM sorting domain-containing protein [Luteolibacter sp. SL250]